MKTTETIENKIDIHLPEDLSKVTSKTRESIYFLQSIETFFKEHVVSKEHYNPDFLDENGRHIDECLNKFEELENKIYFPEKSQILPNGMHQLGINLIELSNIVIDYIELQEKVDELQLIILKYLFKIENDLLLNLGSKEKYLRDLVIQESGGAFLYSAFEHSHNEDRLDNYRIFLSDKKTVKEYIKTHTHPIPLKKRNYDFLLNKHRELYKIIRKAQIQLITNSSRLREEEEIKKMNLEQFKLNGKINKLTIITTILAIIGFVYTSLSLYLQSTDNTINVEIENGAKIEKIENVLKKIQNNIGTKNSVDKESILILKEIEIQLKNLNNEK